MKPQRRAVILVDHRTRDLMLAVLIAHHLERKGVATFLEPLESYHGALAAFSPDLILFNHVNSSHLVRYSQRLARSRVLTAVLPNEGLIYDDEMIRYNSGKFHKGANMDFYFCWNAKHQAGLQAARPGGDHTRIEVSGVPRFDFYFAPWSRTVNPTPRAKPRPLVLICTNLGFARFDGLPAADAERFFAPFTDRLPLYRDYKSLIAVQVRERERLLHFLNAITSAEDWDVILRPHPREDATYYKQWMQGLNVAAQKRVTLDTHSNITQLILDCNLEISCETCTTALEAWIARKPTLELVFEKHPLYYHEDIARLNVCCDTPAQVVELIRAQLRDPAQAQYQEGRRRHLATWCNSPDGTASERIANILAEAIHKKPPMIPDFTFQERRKGLKLKLLRQVDLPYNFDPLLPLKVRLFPNRYATKDFVYRKTIRPSMVSAAQKLLQSSLDQGQP